MRGPIFKSQITSIEELLNMKGSEVFLLLNVQDNNEQLDPDKKLTTSSLFIVPIIVGGIYKCHDSKVDKVFVQDTESDFYISLMDLNVIKNNYNNNCMVYNKDDIDSFKMWLKDYPKSVDHDYVLPYTQIKAFGISEEELLKHCDKINGHLEEITL